MVSRYCTSGIFRILMSNSMQTLWYSIHGMQSAYLRSFFFIYLFLRNSLKRENVNALPIETKTDNLFIGIKCLTKHSKSSNL